MPPRTPSGGCVQASVGHALSGKRKNIWKAYGPIALRIGCQFAEAVAANSSPRAGERLRNRLAITAPVTDGVRASSKMRVARLRAGGLEHIFKAFAQSIADFPDVRRRVGGFF